jgi:hypothetical protein
MAFQAHVAPVQDRSAMIAKPSAPLLPRRTWHPVAIRLRSSAEGIGAVVVVVAAAMIVVAMVMIVMVLAELVILTVRGAFWAARWYYRRSGSSYG